MPDLVVVGAGPAGAATAYHASRSGLDVLLVDRAAFPRSKTCGDALVPTTLAALERMGVGDLPGFDVDGLRIVHTPTGTERFEWFRDQPAPGRALAVTRAVLDAALVERATHAGATFRPGYVRSVRRLRRGLVGVRLEHPSGIEDVRARSVVVATGSVPADRLLGRVPRRPGAVWGIAARTYVEMATPSERLFEIFYPVRVNGRLFSGYAWIFPVGPALVNVGVGVFRTRQADAVALHRLVEAFLAERLARDPRFAGARRRGRIESASIPVEPCVPDVPDVLYVGDAAGVAHGLTGEGIGAALVSGELAAATLGERPPRATREYGARLRETFASRYRLAPALASLLGSPQMVLGRGWDVIGKSHRTAGEALRRLIWDLPPAGPLPFELPTPRVDAAVRRLRGDVVRLAARLRPLLGELVAHHVTQAELGVGTATALAATVHEATTDGDPTLPDAAFRLLLVLEVVAMLVALHDDLLPALPGDARASTWGRNTLSLVVSDSLIAAALQRLYTFDAPRMRAVGRVARRVLRAHAEDAANAAVPSSRALSELMVMAAGAGTPLAADDPRGAAVRRVARQLAAWRVTPAEASPSRDVLVSLYELLRPGVAERAAASGE
jgi:geranylgeranyl reductase family protein